MSRRVYFDGMLHASQARNITRETREASLRMQAGKIKTGVEDAIARGEYKVCLGGVLEPEISDELAVMGFTCTVHAGEPRSFTVSWD